MTVKTEISALTFGPLGAKHTFTISADGQVWERFTLNSSSSTSSPVPMSSLSETSDRDIIGARSHLLRLLPAEVQKLLRPYFALSAKKPGSGKEGLVGERKAKARVVDFRAKESKERQDLPPEIPKISINAPTPKDGSWYECDDLKPGSPGGYWDRLFHLLNDTLNLLVGMRDNGRAAIYALPPGGSPHSFRDHDRRPSVRVKISWGSGPHRPQPASPPSLAPRSAESL